MTNSASRPSRIAALTPLLLVLTGGLPARAGAVELIPCDFLTVGGRVTVAGGGGSLTIGVAGGLKSAGFWGRVNYKDHGLGLTVESTSITKYFASGPTSRLIEGMARTNLYGNRRFRLTAVTSRPGAPATFRMELDNGYAREGTVPRGRVKLHRGNRNSIAPLGFLCGEPADTTAPTTSITSPGAGATVSGTTTVAANASDDVEVAGVQFQLDGAPLGAEDTTAPYSVAWNTTGASNGSHTLTAVARDTAGNSGTSAPVAVTVSNADTTRPAATVTSPAAGATVSQTIAVNANASDNVGVVGVQFQLDGAPHGAEDTSAPYSVSWNTTTTANGSHTLTAVARDAAGNTGTSAAVTVTVANGPPPDTTAPTATITSPVSGATLSATVTVSADAGDNVGVSGVQFRLDGAALGPEDTSAPYSVAWDTKSAANGSHTLTAVARDAAGNTGTSAAVTVTVANLTGGDLFIAIVNGPVQWRNPDGSLKQVIAATSTGQISSLAFDAARNLYVPHWYAQPTTVPGNFIERYDPSGNHLGTFGGGYDCNPSSMDFDAAGNMYVGHADCSGDILKFDPAGNLIARFDVPVENRGTDHIDLASDGCTMYYASRGPHILRFDVCTNTPLPAFNTQPLPDTPYHLVILPDGGVLVAISFGVARLDASGQLVQTYTVAGERGNLWGGVDYVGDGTFWASNGFNANVYRFDLASGAILASFNTGTGDMTVAGVAVRR